MKTTATAPMRNLFITPGIITGLILLIPLLAMQLSDDVQWGPEDFIVIGVLLFSAAFLYQVLARVVTKPAHRLVIGLAVIGMVLLVWVELAVGLFTSWGS